MRAKTKSFLLNKSKVVFVCDGGSGKVLYYPKNLDHPKTRETVSLTFRGTPFYRVYNEIKGFSFFFKILEIFYNEIREPSTNSFRTL